MARSATLYLVFFVQAGIPVFSAELHNQLGQDGEPGSVASFCSSGLFEDYRAADDFEVPPGASWSIASAKFRYEGGVCYFDESGYLEYPAHLFVYEDALGLPGNLVATRRDQTVFYNEEDFMIVNLDQPIELGSGVFWICIQVDTGEELCSALIGTREPQTGYPFSWQTGHPGDCETWGIGMVCNTYNSDPDLAFALYDSHFLQPVPTLHQTATLFFVAGLLILGLHASAKTKKKLFRFQ